MNEPTNTDTATTEPSGSFFRHRVELPGWAAALLVIASIHLMVTVFAPSREDRVITIIVFVIMGVVTVAALMIRQFASPQEGHGDHLTPPTKVARLAWKRIGTIKVWVLAGVTVLILEAMSLSLIR